MAAIVRLFAGQQDKKASTATALCIWQSSEITKGTRPKSGHTWKSMVQPFRQEADLGAQHNAFKRYLKSTCQTALTTMHNDLDGVLLSKDKVLAKLQKHVQHSHSHLVIFHYAGPADCHGNPLFAHEEVLTCNELLEAWMECRGPSQLLVLILDCPHSNLWVTALSARHPAQRVVLSCAVQALDAGDECRTGAASAWLAIQQWKKLKLQHTPQVAPVDIASKVTSSFCCTWGGDALMDFGLPYYFMSSSATGQLRLRKGVDSAEPSPFKTLTWQDDTDGLMAPTNTACWPTPVAMRPRASLDIPTTQTLAYTMNNTALAKRASVNTVCPETATQAANDEVVRLQPPTGALSASFATWSIKTHNSADKQPLSDSNLAALGNTYGFDRQDPGQCSPDERSLPLPNVPPSAFNGQVEDEGDSLQLHEVRRGRRAGEYGEHATEELLDSNASARNMVSQDSSALVLPQMCDHTAQCVYGNSGPSQQPCQASRKRPEMQSAEPQLGQPCGHTEQHNKDHSNQYIDTLSLELLKLVPDRTSDQACDSLIRVASVDEQCNVCEGTDVRGSRLLTSNIKPEAIFAMLQALRSSTGTTVAACASEKLIQKVVIAGASCASDSSLLDTWENTNTTCAGRTQIGGDEAFDVLFSDEASRWEYLKQLVAGRPELEQELTALQPVVDTSRHPADVGEADRLSRLSAGRSSAMTSSPAFRLLQAMTSQSGRTLAEDVSYQLMRQVLESTDGRSSNTMLFGFDRAAGRTQLQGCEPAEEAFADDAQCWEYLHALVAGDHELEQELMQLKPAQLS